MKVRVTKNSTGKFVQLSVGEHEGERLVLDRGISARYTNFIEAESRAGNGGCSIRKGLLLKYDAEDATHDRLPSINQINAKIRRDRQLDEEGRRLPRIENVLDVLNWCLQKQCHTATDLEAVTSERQVVILEVRNV